MTEIVSRNQFRVIQKPSINFEQEAVRKENMERIRLQNEYKRQMETIMPDSAATNPESAY